MNENEKLQRKIIFLNGMEGSKFFEKKWRVKGEKN